MVPTAKRDGAGPSTGVLPGMVTGRLGSYTTASAAGALDEHERSTTHTPMCEAYPKGPDLPASGAPRPVDEALFDPLTGLWVGSDFRAAWTHIAGGPALLTPPLSIVALDIDHLKRFNERFGHRAGDELLRAVASVLRASHPEVSLAVRCGGDEFAVVLSSTTARGAIRVAERLRQSITDSAGPGRTITVSLGVATQSEGEADPVALFDHALAALSQSKHGERNHGRHPIEVQPSALR